MDLGREKQRVKDEILCFGEEEGVNQENLENILNTIGDPVFVKDQEHRFVLLNDAFCDFIGISRDKLLGNTDYDFFPKEEADVFYEKDNKVLETGKQDTNQEKFSDKNGRKHVIITRKTRYVNPQGKKFIVGTIRDITERKKKEEEARKLASIVESSSDAIIGKNLDGIITSWNKAAEEMYGYSEEEALGQHVTLLAPDKEKEKEIQSIMDKIRKKEKVEAFETIRQRKNGDNIHVSLTVSPISGEDGEVYGASAIARDITEKKQMEERLQESEKKYRVFFENNAVPTAILDEDMNIRLANERFEKVSGYSKEELENGVNVLQLMPKKAEKKAKRYHSLRLEGSDLLPDTYPLTFQDNSGNFRHLLIRASLIPGTRDTLVSGIDITERENAKQRIEESEKKYRNMVENINDALFIYGENGKIIEVNQRACEMLGYSKSELLGRNISEIDSKTSGKKFEIRQRQIFLKGRLVFESEYVSKDGKKLPVSVSANAFEKNDRKIVQCIVRDITSWKKVEQKLKEANEQLKKVNALKTQFLNVTSHELRTPITPVQAQLQMVLQEAFGPLNEKQEESLQMVLRNTRLLNNLIGDILDISRLESGTLKFVLREEDLNEVVRESVETMKSKAERNSISIDLQQENIPPLVVDRQRISQVILNLLNNAIKFSHEGGDIDVSIQKDTSDAIIEVRDEGIGIEEKEQENIFLPFQQVDSSKTREYEGSGIGLALSKGIVNYHGGQLWVESELGEGSTFIFNIPFDSSQRRMCGVNLFE